MIAFKNITLAGAALALVPASVFAPAAPALAQGSTSAQLDAAVGALRGIATLQADFVQIDRSGQSVKGVLTLKRPGRIRFQYQAGVPLLIVADGSALTLVDYEVKQVSRWPIKNSPLGALLDPSRDMSKYGTIQPTGDPDVINVMVKDKAHPEYGTIYLIFARRPSAPGGWELGSWVSLDSQNKRTTVRLTNHRYGMAIPDTQFRFKDPRSPTRR